MHDCKVAIPLLSDVEIKNSNILADRAYGTKKIRSYISEQNADYTIPPKNNNPDPWYCDFWLYKERHLVECFLIKSKHSDVLPLVMTSWLPPFLPLFM